MSDSVPAPTDFTITVNDTQPIWIYCAQTNGNHCQSGMVHAINAPASGEMSFAAYKQKASQASMPSTAPADMLPTGGVRRLSVEVGAPGQFIFMPNNITELPRTVVSFKFNPANHSVVESSFEEPCKPLKDASGAFTGFSSGFIPTQVSPSGAVFDIVIKDRMPIWFYCAQPGGGGHCQRGMVGSINAPAEGNTLEKFAQMAATASMPSEIPPHAPLGGTLIVNGTVITSLNGAVLVPSEIPDKANLGIVPMIGEQDPYLYSQAGGGPPMSYNWPPTISDNATRHLQMMQYLDNALLWGLYDGHDRLRPGGEWDGLYPKTIVDTMGAMAAQARVHRSLSTDSLQNYGRPLVNVCSYTWPSKDEGVTAWLDALLRIILLQLAYYTDVATTSASSDPWMVPALITAITSKARMAAVVNLMQNHVAAPAPREVLLPRELAYSYVAMHYVASCPDGGSMDWAGTVYPPLAFSDVKRAPGPDGRNGTATEVKVDMSTLDGMMGDRYIAWIGPWGMLEYTPISADGSAMVPAGMYGHVWAVVTSQKDMKLREIVNVVMAGPEVLWVGQP